MRHRQGGRGYFDEAGWEGGREGGRGGGGREGEMRERWGGRDIKMAASEENTCDDGKGRGRG